MTSEVLETLILTLWHAMGRERDRGFRFDAALLSIESPTLQNGNVVLQ